MRDIPVFTSEYGAASLFLREIPYRGRAHIKIQSSQEPEKLLEECVSFCRACGADWIDAAGHDYLEKYPRLATLVEMSASKERLGEPDACLFPVTEDTVKAWCDVHNERMKDVPNCALMDSRDGKEMLLSGDGYFIHRGGSLLGIGRAGGDRIDVVAATQKGAGETVVRALASLLPGETVKLTVALENEKALRLYERMGFIPVRQLGRWYRVL